MPALLARGAGRKLFAGRPVKFSYRSLSISAASADPLGRDPLARRDEKSLGRLWRNSFERTDKTPAGDARLSQAPSFDFYLIAFHPCNGNVEAQFRVPLELVRVRLFHSEPDAAWVQF